MAGLFDSHTHLNNPDLMEDIDGVVERLLEAGVELQLDTMAVETRVEDGKVSGIVAADSSGMVTTSQT